MATAKIAKLEASNRQAGAALGAGLQGDCHFLLSPTIVTSFYRLHKKISPNSRLHDITLTNQRATELARHGALRDAGSVLDDLRVAIAGPQ